MTAQERAALDARDPEMVLVVEYLKEIETWTPAFDKNLKRCLGKERREKRFLSKISY